MEGYNQLLNSEQVIGETIELNVKEQEVLLGVEWTCHHGAVADLDLACYVYDFNAECTDIIDFNQNISKNRSIFLSEDTLSLEGGNSNEEVFIDLQRVERFVRAIVVTVMGVSGNLGSIYNVKSYCCRMRFMDDGNKGHRTKSKWETCQILEQHPLVYGRVKLNAIECAKNNIVCLYKLYRDNPGDIKWKVEVVFKPCLATMREDRIREPILICLLDIFPWMKPEKLRFFPNVKAVCAALSSQTIPNLKKYFFHQTLSPHGEGLNIFAFVKVLFIQIHRMYAKQLKNHVEASHLVALLLELFEQIDINGDGFVDWEEFTSYCIEAGVLERNEGGLSNFALDTVKVMYVEDKSFSHTKKGQQATKAQINFILFASKTKRLIVVEQSSCYFQVFDNKGKFFNKYAADGGLQVTTERVISHGCFVPERLALVFSCSDQTILIVTEQLDSSGDHKSYICVGKMVHEAFHKHLCWVEASQLLFSISTENIIYGWDLDELEVSFRLDPKTDVLIDLIFIKEKFLIATACLDKKIHLYAADTMNHRAILTGHAFGVRKLKYGQDILLSLGFEQEIFGWDLTTRELTFKLKGHLHPVKFIDILDDVKGADLIAVSVDAVGEIRFWDCCNAYGGFAICKQAIKIPGVDTQRPINAIAKPYDKKMSIGQYSNLIFGGLHAWHFVPKSIMDEFTPPTYGMFNSSSSHFFVSILNKIHIWGASTGKYLRVFDNITPHAITCCTQDSPRDRRLFIGNEKGEVMITNYINGNVMFFAVFHEGDVSHIFRSTKQNIVITVGIDKKIQINQELNGGLDELRAIENSHEDAITSFIYSYELSILISSGVDGKLHFWDFQNLKNWATSIKLDGEVACMLNLEPYPYIITSDYSGGLKVWHFDIYDHKINLYCNLEIKDTAYSRRKFKGKRKPLITCFTSHITGKKETKKKRSAVRRRQINNYILGASDTGEIYVWLLKDIFGVKGLKTVPKNDCPPYQTRYMPYSKMKRKVNHWSLPVQDVKDFVPVKPNNCFNKLNWRAHCDAITTICVIENPPCIYSMSCDGYQRLWDVQCDGQSVGEMRLPNVDAMRRFEKRKSFPNIEYTFFKNHITLSAEHEAMATEILTAIQKGKTEQLILGFANSIQLENSNRAKMKNRIQAKKLEARKQTFITAYPDAQDFGNSIENSKINDFIHELYPGSDLHKKHALKLGSFLGITKNREEEDNQNANLPQVKTSTKRKHLVAAFSEESIRKGAEDALFDKEAMTNFRKMNSLEDRQRLYDKEYPWTIDKMNEAVRALSLPTLTHQKSLQFVAKNYKYAMAELNNPNEAQTAPARIARFSTSYKRMPEAPAPKNKRGNMYFCDRLELSEKNILSEDDKPTARVWEAYDFDEMFGTNNKQKEKDIEFKNTCNMVNDIGKKVHAKVKNAMQEKDMTEQKFNFDKLSNLQIYLRNAVKIDNFVKLPSYDRKDLRPGIFGPFYSIQDVIGFRDVYNKVDEDFNGGLDSDEWVTFLQKLNSNLSETLGKKLFLQLDKKRQGELKLEDLIPILFDKATAIQHKIMFDFIESENNKVLNKSDINKTELEDLFDLQDKNKTGFLNIQQALEALKELRIPEDQRLEVEMSFEDNKKHLLRKEEFVKLVLNLNNKIKPNTASRNELEDLFEMHDKKKEGAIPITQILEALKEFRIPDEQVKELEKEYEGKLNTSMKKDEFITLALNTQKKIKRTNLNKSEVEDMFDLVDTKKAGFLNLSQVMLSMQNLRFTPDKLRESEKALEGKKKFMKKDEFVKFVLAFSRKRRGSS